VRLTGREGEDLARTNLNVVASHCDPQPPCDHLDDDFPLRAMLPEKPIRLEHEQDDRDRPPPCEHNLPMPGDWRVWFRAKAGNLFTDVDLPDSRGQSLARMLPEAVARATHLCASHEKVDPNTRPLQNVILPPASRNFRTWSWKAPPVCSAHAKPYRSA
jgi:hypothetical protein